MKKLLKDLQNSDAKSASGSPQTLRIVFDTNIWYSALLYGGKSEFTLIKSLKQHTIIANVPLFDELSQQLKLAKAPYKWRRAMLTAIEKRAMVVELDTVSAAGVRDPDDEMVIAIAITGQADVIVTGDKDLLELEVYRGIVMMSLAEWLELDEVINT